MSFEAMTWAVKIKLPVQQKIVLLMLANRTNADDGLCIPSMDRLARDCGMSKASVRRAIKGLAEAGHIEVIPRWQDQVQLSNQYRLHMGGALVRGVVADSKGGGSRQQGGVVADSHPKQRDQPEKINRESPAGLFSLQESEDRNEETKPDLFDEFWKEYPKSQRKVAKPQCRKTFWDTVHGKRKGVDRVAAETIIRGARAFAASNPDPQFVPAPLVWLNQCRWEAFADQPEPTNKYREMMRRSGVA